MNKFIVATASIVALTCMACSGSSIQDAGEENFTNVLNAYLQKEGITIDIGAKMPFQVDIERITPKKPPKNIPAGAEVPKRLPDLKRPSFNSPTGMRARFEALERAGLFASKQTIVERKDSFIFNSPAMVKYKVKQYEPTKKGQAVLKSPDAFKTSYRLQIATAAVEKIENFTAPAQVEGYTLSKVKYTYSPGKVHSFAKSADIIKSFPKIKDRLKSGQSELTTLVLMGSGWEHVEVIADQIK